MSTRRLRSAMLTVGSVGAAMLAVTFLPGGVAAAEPEDELLWLPDTNAGNFTWGLPTLGIFGEQETGAGELDAYTSLSDYDNGTMPYLTDELTANANALIPFLGTQSITYDITTGDAAIPAGSTIDVNLIDGLATETVEVPNAGLFGLLPEITFNLFTPLGEFSF
jgi:hypothetical protein